MASVKFQLSIKFLYHLWDKYGWKTERNECSDFRCPKTCVCIGSVWCWRLIYSRTKIRKEFSSVSDFSFFGRRPRNRHIDSAKSAKLILWFSLFSRSFRLAYNSLCAFASVNHLHFHLWYLEQKLFAETMVCESIHIPTTVPSMMILQILRGKPICSIANLVESRYNKSRVTWNFSFITSWFCYTGVQTVRREIVFWILSVYREF